MLKGKKFDAFALQSGRYCSRKEQKTTIKHDTKLCRY